jgi:uncharacterized membrane protein
MTESTRHTARTSSSARDREHAMPDAIHDAIHGAIHGAIDDTVAATETVPSADMSAPAPTTARTAAAPAANSLAWVRARFPGVPANVAGSAREAVGQLRDKFTDLDLRRRIADLKKTSSQRTSDPTSEQPRTQTVLPTRSSTRARIVAPDRLSWMSWMFVAGCLFAAGVAHIITVFALPLFSTTSAFERLRPLLPVNTMTALPPAAPGAATGTSPPPFLSPDMRYAMCRYDLSSGPLLVSAILPEAGWSLAIHAPDGENFYLVPGQDQRRTDISFTIARSGERPLIATPGVRRSDVDATQVTSPRLEGLVVIRAPVRGLAYRGEIEAILKTATCRALTR